jgi:uncharacterized protein (TIGR02266 family)
MTAAEPGRISAALPARRARQALSPALGLVQQIKSAGPHLTLIIAELAGASDALYRVENEVSTEEAGISLMCGAIEQLTRALTLLQEAKLSDGALEIPAQAVARTLAMLYPVSHAASRRRREVMPQGALSDAEINALRAVAARNSRAFGGPERRNSPEPRVFFEVEIGLSSESNFYTGLTLDVSSGGVFVSTHQPAASGSEVTLFFVLPSGHPVEVTGVVRWTRTASEDSTPGMGVAFTQLEAADLAAIAEYCGYRAPLFHENE